MKTFEDYLADVFMSSFFGTKEQAEDSFEYWLANLDIQEVIDYADVYAQKQVGKEIYQNIIK